MRVRTLLCSALSRASLWQHSSRVGSSTCSWSHGPTACRLNSELPCQGLASKHVRVHTYTPTKLPNLLELYGSRVTGHVFARKTIKPPEARQVLYITGELRCPPFLVRAPSRAPFLMYSPPAPLVTPPSCKPSLLYLLPLHSPSVHHSTYSPHVDHPSCTRSLVYPPPPPRVGGLGARLGGHASLSMYEELPSRLAPTRGPRPQARVCLSVSQRQGDL